MFLGEQLKFALQAMDTVLFLKVAVGLPGAVVKSHLASAGDAGFDP